MSETNCLYISYTSNIQDNVWVRFSTAYQYIRSLLKDACASQKSIIVASACKYLHYCCDSIANGCMVLFPQVWVPVVDVPLVSLVSV